MKRGIVLCAVALGVLGIGAGGALAGGSAKTTVVFDTIIPLSDDPSKDVLSGHLKSPEAKCLAKRKVAVKFFYEAVQKPVVDVDTSSAKGAFAGIGPESHKGGALAGATITVAKKQVGGTTCKGDSDSVA